MRCKEAKEARDAGVGDLLVQLLKAHFFSLNGHSDESEFFVGLAGKDVRMGAFGGRVLQQGIKCGSQFVLVHRRALLEQSTFFDASLRPVRVQQRS